jgi:aminoglycoside phosphotransferase (APT) family kinase protein
MATNMPAADVEITGSLVESLLRSQRPDLAQLKVRLLANGWDNVSFRVGDSLVARIPRRELAAHLIENEASWLPTLAPLLPLAVPTPDFLGVPDQGYPWRWAVVPWIPGIPVGVSTDLDLPRAAESLGRFLRALHRPAPPEAPENPFRGIPLKARDASTRERILRLGSVIDATAVLAVWDVALDSPEFDGDPVWLHGDLHPNNLLASDGRLTGVVDFGDITASDPATDLSIAWMLFPPDLRARFRDSYGDADHETWRRARGWALSLGTAYLAYSADNPAMGGIGKKTMQRVLADR